MNSAHKIFYAYEVGKDGGVFKFAEYPFDLIKMKVPMPKGELLKDLSLDIDLLKAYKAAQESLWLGAFMYIRRVVEGIVNYIAKDKNIENWNSKTVGQKIEFIKSELPSWVKDNIKAISGILGDAIHNWTEETAKNNYQTILAGISLMIKKINDQIDEQKLELELTKEIHFMRSSKNNK